MVNIRRMIVIIVFLVSGKEIFMLSACAQNTEEDSSYALLTKDLEFQTPTYHSSFDTPYPESFPDSLTLSRPMQVKKGSLVYVDKKTEYLFLIDGSHLAKRYRYNNDDICFIKKSTCDSICDIIFKHSNVLCMKNGDNNVRYIATILPDKRLLVNFSSYRFIGELIFIKDRNVTLYKNAKSLSTSKITAVWPPECTIGLGSCKIEIPDTSLAKKKILLSTKKIYLRDHTITPEYSVLLQRPNNTGHGETSYSYELIGELDLDNDGVNELIFADYGWEAVSFSIFKYIHNEWKCIYKGGGDGC